MSHPDFRVNGKIFATLGYPNQQFGMVRLTPEQQETFVHEHPAAFSAIKGAWGRQGATQVRLEAANVTVLRRALDLAWDNVAKTAVARKRRQKSCKQLY